MGYKPKKKTKFAHEMEFLRAHLNQPKDSKSSYQKIEKALKESGAKLKSILSSLSDFVFVFDKDARFVFYNAPPSELFLPPEEFLWKKHSQVMPPAVHKLFAAAFARNKKGKTQEYEYQLNVDGKKRWYSTRLSPMFLDSKFVGSVALVRDITEHKQVEQQLGILTKELLKSSKKLKQLATLDYQTGLYNHRYLEKIIEVAFQRARKHAQPLAVIMLDIDYFKSINDVYGHEFGDLVLRQFAKELKRIVRAYDIVIRFSGEEFVVLCTGTDRNRALSLAQRLLETLNFCNFGDKNHTVKLKLSLAVASYPEDKIAKGMDLVDLADKILEKAKESGGNRISSSLDIKKRKYSLLHRTNEIPDINLLKGKIEKLNKKAHESLVEAIFAFAKTIELKDHYTGEHVESTVHYATEIAMSLGLSRDEIELVRQASMLHDLGKIGISENILLKKSKLTEKEFAEIKKHPQIGADILRPIQILHSLIPFIFYHHERWDGKGYPSGIKGEQIPVGARIIAIADVYQALISDRPYRKAYSKSEAIKIMKRGSGTQFDPSVVSVFLKILKKEK